MLLPLLRLGSLVTMFARAKDAAISIEYAVIAMLIAVVIVPGVSSIRTTVSTMFTLVAVAFGTGGVSN